MMEKKNGDVRLVPICKNCITRVRGPRDNDGLFYWYMCPSLGLIELFGDNVHDIYLYMA